MRSIWHSTRTRSAAWEPAIPGRSTSKAASAPGAISVATCGVDGQTRVRASGDTLLPGGRRWDFAGGPQLLVASGHFFAALSAGPATMGVLDGIGWTAIASFGGSTL